MRALAPYWNSRSLAADLFADIDRLFENFGRLSTLPVYDERSFTPACEITEAEDHYLMSIDLPGMKKEDIKVEVIDNVLTVSGERKREFSSDRNEKIQRYEKSYGFFKRSFTPPSTVEVGKVEARYEDGVLELYLPKAQAAKPHQIEIQSGKGGIFAKLLGKKGSHDEKTSET